MFILVRSPGKLSVRVAPKLVPSDRFLGHLRRGWAGYVPASEFLMLRAFIAISVVDIPSTRRRPLVARFMSLLPALPPVSERRPHGHHFGRWVAQ